MESEIEESIQRQQTEIWRPEVESKPDEDIEKRKTELWVPEVDLKGLPEVVSPSIPAEQPQAVLKATDSRRESQKEVSMTALGEPEIPQNPLRSRNIFLLVRGGAVLVIAITIIAILLVSGGDKGGW